MSTWTYIQQCRLLSLHPQPLPSTDTFPSYPSPPAGHIFAVVNQGMERRNTGGSSSPLLSKPGFNLRSRNQPSGVGRIQPGLNLPPEPGVVFGSLLLPNTRLHVGHHPALQDGMAITAAAPPGRRPRARPGRRPRASGTRSGASSGSGRRKGRWPSAG